VVVLLKNRHPPRLVHIARPTMNEVNRLAIIIDALKSLQASGVRETDFTIERMQVLKKSCYSLVVLLLAECSLVVLPPGEASFEVDDGDECSVVVTGAAATGTATIRAGATITGAGYTVTIFGAGAAVVVSVVTVSVLAANPTAAPPNSITEVRANAEIVNERFTTSMSPLAF